MSLFGSLFTGVSGLGAESQSTAMIANNIANINTTGFKRSEAAFYSLVTSEGRSSKYSPGTVSVNRVQQVNLQGPIQQTSSTTDAAISGNGMFAVKRDTVAGQEFLYTRSGSFSEDSQGLLRNSAGFVLYGWPLGEGNSLPSNQGDLSSLAPVNVAFLGGLTRPTTAAELAINLNADQREANGSLATTPYTLPVPNDVAPHFSRGLTVYDSLGSAQTLTIEYRKINGPMANLTSGVGGLQLNTSLTDPAVFPGNANGDEFSITVNGVTETYTFVSGAPATGTNEIQTVGDLLNKLNESYGAGELVDAKLDEGGRLVVQAKNPSHTMTFAEVTGNPLTAAGTFNLITQPGGVPLTYTSQAPIQGPYTSTEPYPNQGDFPDLANITNPNTQGWWEVTIKHPNGSNISKGLMNFDSVGSLNANAGADNVVDIELRNIDWFNGSAVQNIDIDISRFSQFAGNYDVIFADQNGAELGLRTGVDLTRDGFVVARFSNGATANLYKVPLVTFANMNGLQEVSGTAYSESSESGEENLREAGTGGAGYLEPSTLESSNVDLADEFARLIVSQRAYSANTRVINTVDSMTEELLRLR
jgi:flagellar hook-basal body protein